MHFGDAWSVTDYLRDAVHWHIVGAAGMLREKTIHSRATREGLASNGHNIGIDVCVWQINYAVLRDIHAVDDSEREGLALPCTPRAVSALYSDRACACRTAGVVDLEGTRGVHGCLRCQCRNARRSSYRLIDASTLGIGWAAGRLGEDRLKLMSFDA